MLGKLILMSLTSFATLASSPRDGHVGLAGQVVTSPKPARDRASEVPIPITVIVMDSFGDKRLLGGVRRTVGAERKNLIVVKRSALKPALLAELARAMRASVAKHGANPAQQVSMYVMKERRLRSPTATESAWAKQIIAQLGVARTRSFGKMGVQRAVESTLPQ